LDESWLQQGFFTLSEEECEIRETFSRIRKNEREVRRLLSIIWR